jgi:glycosyltransferase involved in cell wall biosynthesis
MKVVGFTIVRNAIKYDYPVVESLNSLLPLCDEVIVAVGKSEDDTLNLIRSIQNPKIKIIETAWDDSLRTGGVLLAAETNKAFDVVPVDADWAIYLQADEVLHENDIPAIKEAMLKWKDEKSVEGLLFNYKHFYGSYQYIGDSYKWYRKEIRVIKNDKHIRSYKDAQGFRKYSEAPTHETLLNGGEKLKVKPVNACVYHYGWVKHPALQQNKQADFHKMWHDDNWVKENVIQAHEFDYSVINSLEKYTGSHPAAMKGRIEGQSWKFEFDNSMKKVKVKERFIKLCETIFGWRPGEYKNYKLI